MFIFEKTLADARTMELVFPYRLSTQSKYWRPADSLPLSGYLGGKDKDVFAVNSKLARFCNKCKRWPIERIDLANESEDTMEVLLESGHTFNQLRKRDLTNILATSFGLEVFPR